MSDCVFEEYVIHCVQRRPVDLEWHGQIKWAALGLFGQSNLLIRAAQASGLPEGCEGVARFREIARNVEFYRALLYYQLDLRPDVVATQTIRADAPSVAGAAQRLAVRGGVLSFIADDLLAVPSDESDGRLRSAASAFEMARADLLNRLGVTPECLWLDDMASSQSRPVAVTA
jgi:hypothetical protein